MPLLTCHGRAAVIGRRDTRLKTARSAPVMSPVPTRTRGRLQPPQARRRIGRPRCRARRRYPGPAEVQARLELHLSQCRRRGAVLALLCVNVDAVLRAERRSSAPAWSSGYGRRYRTVSATPCAAAMRSCARAIANTCVVMPGADTAGRRARRPAPGAPGQRRLPRRRRTAAGRRAHRRRGASGATDSARRNSLRKAADRDPDQCVAPSSASATNFADRRRFSSARSLVDGQRTSR